jgi:hypothetical protein
LQEHTIKLTGHNLKPYGPRVPIAWATEIFPGLQRHRQRQLVQLSVTVDGKDSTPAGMNGGVLSAWGWHACAACFEHELPDVYARTWKETKEVHTLIMADNAHAHTCAKQSPMTACAGGLKAPDAAVACYLTQTQRHLSLIRAGPVLRSYLGHTVTGMSCARGSTRLTLHLQSPAAAAAAEQAAEAAAAAVEADPAAWKEHQVGWQGWRVKMREVG